MGRRGSTWAAVGLLVASACGQDTGADAGTTSRGSSSSATSATTPGSVTSVGSSGGTTDVPEPPPPAPEGEVVCTEPLSTGQSWCWKVVAVPALVEGATDNFATDLDGDGRDELVMAHTTVDGVPCMTVVDHSKCLSVLSWTDEEFVRRGDPLKNAGANDSQTFTYAADYDGDGDLDLVRPDATERASFFLNEAGVLQPRLVLEFPQEPNWAATPLPIDPNEDGILELFVGQNGVGRIHERRGDTWAPVTGKGFVLPNCGGPNSVVRADFDEDGTDDYAILETGASCDYQNPATWNPGSPVISIYLTEPVTGTLREPTWLPVSGDFLASSGYPFWAWAADLDEDGHLDLVFRAGIGEAGIEEGWENAIGYVLGRGDGTFQSYEVIVDNPSYLEAVTDLDEDGTIEVLSRGRPTGEDSARTYVLQDVLGARRMTELPMSSAVANGEGDLNGDESVDLVMFDTPFKTASRRYVLMSVPAP